MRLNVRPMKRDALIIDRIEGQSQHQAGVSRGTHTLITGSAPVACVTILNSEMELKTSVDHRAALANSKDRKEQKQGQRKPV